MNQEHKEIYIHLEKESDKDYMVFEFEEAIKVCFSDESGQNDLRKVFAMLMSQLIEEPIKLVYRDVQGYKTGLYIDVCREYIIDLNNEIEKIRERIPEELQEIKLNKS